MSKRFIVIGDIHSCAKELNNLLNKLSVTSDDTIISIGDIIHKGPDASESLRILRMVCDEFVLGNHEEKQIRWENHERTGKPNPMKKVSDYEVLSEDDGIFIRENSRLFIQLTAGEKKFILIHGGIEPAMRALPSTNELNKLIKKERYHSMNMLRTRFVNPFGRMVSLGEEKPEDVYWADVYDGRFGHAVFGHQPFLQNAPMNFPNATGIDLGCVYGGHLCALIIDGETGRMNYSTTPALQKYKSHRDE
jgi:serine/threonine protein phosphatase 1